MDDTTRRRRRQHARQRANRAFVGRLLERRPSSATRRDELHARLATEATGADVEAESPELGEAPSLQDMVFETIVFEERPVLFVQDDWINQQEVTIIGSEAQDLVDDLVTRRDTFVPLMPLVGRIDVTNFPGLDYVGTGWFVAADVVVTNRHVASLIARWNGLEYAFTRGVAGRTIASSFSTAHEFDDLVPDQARSFAVEEVLYIEPDASDVDIAFLRVRRRTDGARPDRISIAAQDVVPDTRVLTVGYPARASRQVIPNQQLMNDLYLGRFDVKRAAPGLALRSTRGPMQHDCTTLGGNSGSVVLDLATGEAVGLHFAGLYQESNFAVQATLLSDYVGRKRWLVPRIEVGARPLATVPVGAAPQAGSVVVGVTGAGQTASVTIPLSITVAVGAPTAASAGSSTSHLSATDLRGAQAAAKAFWAQRPDGVIAVRVGFEDDGDAIGDRPIIAASSLPDRVDAVRATAPAHFQGLEVRYFPAEVAEQLDALPLREAIDRIAYDDSARTGPGFSFARVDEEMTVLAHVGPEYSWDVLKEFLEGATESLISAMYEFHGPHIADVIEARLEDGVSLRIVLDNLTFSKVRDEDQEFDRTERFGDWERFDDAFERIVAPEGTSGLIANAYHIKVTVREDDTFWLSSGNWKMSSSQPLITDAQRDNATNKDLPGNREWHVVVANSTLADRFRNHIRQDFERSRELGGGSVPESREGAEIFVDVPIEEAFVLERRAPERILEPTLLEGRIRVKPLLTPDRSGRVYCDAVLGLIDSAQESLLFQIPYISMPSNPDVDRGFIDELIAALAGKLESLPDARLLLRSGGSRFSSPTHVAWFFKSKGVDVASRVRRIDNHHTKGMIVDGKRVLLGSHNWSQPGVTLNRDASLLFDDADIAGYYAEAFEIDWNRSNPITPRRFVRESTVFEAVGATPPPAYRRVRLYDLLKEEE